MSEITTRAGDGALQEHVPPEELRIRDAVFKDAEKQAERDRDLLALRKACEGRLRNNLLSWRQYTERFPHGGDRSKTTETDALVDQWCRDRGVSQRTVQRWAYLADPAELEKLRDRIVEATAKRLDMEEAANFSSESNEWYTPAPYIAAARALYGGGIDLDPATSLKANETVQASQIFTIDDDALQHPWHGRAFLNPPYGKDGQESMAGKFCRYAIHQHEIGNLEACVILVNSVHSQRWQAPLYDWPVCFVDHRIQFVNGEGLENKSPTFQNIFVYVGGDVLGFVEHFSPFGYVMGRIVDV